MNAATYLELYILGLDFVKRRGPNAPLGLWAAEVGSHPALSEAAWQVATALRKEIDAGRLP